MRPKRSVGTFFKRRQLVAYILILTFLVLPVVEIGGHPAILLDVMSRRFYFFGAILHPTDSVLLMLFMLCVFLGVFWITALYGRVWCGWGCPQIVYMEFIFRPIERLLEGNAGQQRELDKQGAIPPWPRLVKYVVFLLIAFVLSNQFLSYFVGWKQLATWVVASPLEHPEGFAIVAVTTGLVFFDFAYFREQMCTVICPYARLQSALVDGSSLIVGYDKLRGEARRRIKQRSVGDNSGDCINCKACVHTCPTGIDIRDGLQLECIACTQCVDACDHVMSKLGKAPGLIRLSSQKALETGKPTSQIRVRTVMYPGIIFILLGVMILSVWSQGSADLTILRQLNAPYVVESDGRIRNQLRIKIVNRSGGKRTYTLFIPSIPAESVLAPQFPLTLSDKDSLTTPVFITLEPSLFSAGSRSVTVQVTDDQGFNEAVEYSLLAPEEDS